MSQFWGRILMLLAVSTLATTLAAQPPTENVDPGGEGSGGSSCSRCNIRQSGNVITMSCGSPGSGEWGYEHCRIESYPEGTYCFVDGNQCCVD